MNKNMYFIVWLTILFLITPTAISAYNLGIDVNQFGYVKYSYPAVLGDEEKPEEHKVEDKKEERKPEIKETPRVEKPEKIEIKKEENKIRVELKKQNKVEQKMTPKKASLEFPSVPKTTPIHKSEVEDIGESHVDTTDEVLKDRSERKDEKVEVQSETHDDGTVELQIESRTVKAKIKNSEIELDVKNNNIGITNTQGEKIELVHLPDQAIQKFSDLGVSTVPDSLEIGQSGDNLEYTVDATKMQKLFGLFPRETKFKLSLNDSNGNVEQQKFANNLFEQVLNLFTF